MDSTESRQDFWFNHIQRCQGEGITLKAYAEREGLTLSVLYGWSKRYQKARVPQSPNFLQAVIKPPQRMGTYRLHFPNGLILEWDAAADTRQLGPLLELLS